MSTKTMYFRGIFFLLSAVFILFKCADNPDLIPANIGYVGDYNLHIPNIDTSTFFAGIPRQFDYTQGNDKYTKINVFTVPAGGIDQRYFLGNITETSIGLYFTKPFNGEVAFVGTRQNDQKDTFQIQITVKSPFTISGPSLLMVGDTGKWKLDTVDGAGSASDMVAWALWSIDSMKIDSLRYETPWQYSPRVKKDITVHCSIVDRNNYTFSLQPTQVSVPAIRPAITQFTLQDSCALVKKPLSFSLKVNSFTGDSGTLQVLFPNDSVATHLNFTSDSCSQIIQWSKGAVDTGSIDLYAQYTNKYNRKTEKLALKVNVYVKVPSVTFTTPDTIWALPNIPITIRATAQTPKYRWKIGTAAAQTSTKADTTLVAFTDSSSTIQVTVAGVDSAGYLGTADTCYIQYYRTPYAITFTKKPDSTLLIDTPYLWEVKTTISHISALPKGTYRWKFTKSSDSSVIFDTSGTTLTVLTKSFPVAQPVTLTVTYTDTTNLASLAGHLQHVFINVYPKIDTITTIVPIYTGKTATFTVSTTQAQTKSKITGIRWNFDSGTLWDTTTILPTLQHKFFTPGVVTVKTSCIDSLGYSSPVKSLLVNVLDGAPVVDTIYTPENTTFYIRKAFNCDFNSHDPSGANIDSSVVILKKGTDSLLYYAKLTRVSVSVNDASQAGVYSVGGRVRNSNGIWSKTFWLTNTLTIDKGLPTIQSFTYDTAWINDTNTYVIKASDPDGTIKKVIVQWNDGRVDTTTTDSAVCTKTIQHNYIQAQQYSVKVYAIDNYDNISAAFEKTVQVHRGTPRIVPKSDTFKRTYSNGTVRTFKTLIQNDTLYAPYFYSTAFNYVDTTFLMIASSAFDTNGTIKNRYLDITQPFDTTGTGAYSLQNDTITIPIIGTDRTRFQYDAVPVRCMLFCKDDENFVDSTAFYLNTVTTAPVTLSAQDSIRAAMYTVAFTTPRLSDIPINQRNNCVFDIQIKYNQDGSSVYQDSVTIAQKTLQNLVLGANNTATLVLTIPQVILNQPSGSPIKIEMSYTDFLNQKTNFIINTAYKP